MNGVGLTYNYKEIPYRGTAKVTLDKTEKGLLAKIETARLEIHSFGMEDLANYEEKLYGNLFVMSSVSYGVTKLLSVPIERHGGKTRAEVWIDRWKNNHPFSAMAIYEKESRKFVGHVMLRDCGEAGQTEIHYLLDPAMQGKRYGIEAASALIYELLPVLARNGYPLQGKTVDKVMGTARSDNERSWRILEATMQFQKDEVKYGGMRKFYKLTVEELLR